MNLELKKEELIQISKNKKTKRHKKSNGKSNLLILMLSLKFIGTNPSQQSSNTVLRKFLLLNKESNALLKRQVLKQALLYETDIARLKAKRILIWKKLLGFE